MCVAHVLRKPPQSGVLESILMNGTSGLNINAIRVGTTGGTRREGRATISNASGWANMKGHGIATLDTGRWPSNVLPSFSVEIHDSQYFQIIRPHIELSGIT